MNTQKLAQAFLQLSQAFATIHEALLEQPPVSEAQVRADATAAQVDPARAAEAAQAARAAEAAQAARAAEAAQAATAPPSQQYTAFLTPPSPQYTALPDRIPDQFQAFSDQLKGILQTVPPGALNAQLGQMIERYAPGAGAPGQGGIRKIPEAQYANFLAEVRRAAAALGGAVQ